MTPLVSVIVPQCPLCGRPHDQETISFEEAVTRAVLMGYIYEPATEKQKQLRDQYLSALELMKEKYLGNE